MTKMEKAKTIRDLATLDRLLVKFHDLLDSSNPLPPETESIIRVRRAVNQQIEKLEGRVN